MTGSIKEDLLQSGIREIGFSAEASFRIAEKMERYIKQIQLYNSAYNLVNTNDHDEIAVRHILDSLSAAPKIKMLMQKLCSDDRVADKIKIADIGSGAGLPGIPLAAVFPESSFTLIERMSKRCAFLENCILMLKLDNVKVENRELEKMPRDSVQLAVFRAFRPLSGDIIKALFNIISPGGIIAAYKAKKEKIKKEMDNIAYLVPDYETYSLKVPFLTDCNESDRERNLVILRKS